MSVRLKISDEFVHLSRGAPFEVETEFKYKGQPQKLTFKLMMKQGAFGTQYSCVYYPTIDVGAAMDWGSVGPLTLAFKVPAGVKDGGQDLQLHITAADGEHDESSWLTDAIFIGA